MEKFSFSSTSNSVSVTTFNGPKFYHVYKTAEFLRSSENVEKILSQGYALRKSLNTVAPGKSVKIEGMILERNTPLLVKRTGENVVVEDYEFTYNRLSGLVAAFAFENRHRFPNIESSEAKALGLKWDNCNEEKCKLFLSAVSGTEHFTDHFSYWPLICALRKFQLKKMPEHLIIKMGKIKNDVGIRMANVLYSNLVTTHKLWMYFSGSTERDLQIILTAASPTLKKLFTNND